MIDARALPKALGGLILTAAAAAAVFQPAGGGAAGIALPLILIAIGCWAGGFLPDHVTGLGFFAAVLLLKLAPADLVLSGFTSSSLWLVLAGLVLGLAMDETGLGKRLASLAGGLEGASYGKLIGFVVALGVAACFIMPSAMGRIVLLLGLVGPLAVHLGYDKGGRGHTGLMVAAAFGTFLPAFSVLPANVPNMIVSSALERMNGQGAAFGDYLLLHFPVLGLGRALAVWALATWLYRAAPDRAADAAPPAPGPMSKAEKRLAWVLGLAVGLWVTDAFHHISPAWVALTGAVICMAPQFGVLKADAIRKLNMAPIFHVAAVVGLGAVADKLGLGAWMAESILGWMPLAGTGGLHDFAALLGLSTLLGVLTTAPGVPAVLMPMADVLAGRSGFSVFDIAMIQVMGLSTVLLPHQVPPLMAAAQVSGAGYHEFVRMCLLTALVGALLLLPLDALWWTVLGRM